jgi:hypothetical protein
LGSGISFVDELFFVGDTVGKSFCVVDEDEVDDQEYNYDDNNDDKNGYEVQFWLHDWRYTC